MKCLEASSSFLMLFEVTVAQDQHAEVQESRKGDAKIFDVAKVDAKKIEEIKDDAKKAELPPTSSSLFVSSAPIPLPPITTNAPTITTTVLEFDALFVVQLRVAKLEKDVSELKKIDHSAKALATLKSQVPTVVEQYLGSKIGDDLQKAIYLNTPALFLQLVDERNAEDDIEVFSTEPGLDWISAHNFLT
ncbi:hypothetical protein Tco_1111137 [Tanacetum coccineum]|uniref:Uncharacterized protein n=1 Tax=Tanacetum coccineum TaxID=301880 RepID=A0ABQ5IL16_9ASTR